MGASRSAAGCTTCQRNKMFGPNNEENDPENIELEEQEGQDKDQIWDDKELSDFDYLKGMVMA